MKQPTSFCLSTCCTRNRLFSLSLLCRGVTRGECARAWICLVIISKLIIWYLLRFYLCFFFSCSVSLSTAVSFYVCFVCIMLVFFFLVFSSASPFIYGYVIVALLHCCIENLKTISFCCCCAIAAAPSIARSNRMNVF